MKPIVWGLLLLAACKGDAPADLDAAVVPDAEVPDAEVPDAEVPDAEVPAPVRVTVSAAGAPEADVDVVFSDTDGVTLAGQPTDASGVVEAIVPAGGAVTAVANDGVRFTAMTWLGVEPGDQLTWIRTPAPPTDVGSISVTLPGAFGGASQYVVQIGCDALVTSTPAVAVSGTITSACIGVDPDVAVIATAIDATGAVIAYSVDPAVTPVAAGTATVTLGAWQTATDPLDVTVTGAPAGAARVLFEHHARIDGGDYIGLDRDAAFASGAVAIDGGYFQGVTQQLESRLWIELGTEPEDGRWVLRERHVDAPAAVSVDLGAVSLPALGAVSVAVDAGRVAITYDAASSVAGVADAGLAVLSWLDVQGVHEWRVLVPPDAPTTFTLPAVSLVETPAVGAAFDPPSLAFVQADFVADYDAVRNGPGFGLFDAGGLATAPSTWQATVAGDMDWAGRGSCSDEPACPDADANRVTVCGRLRDVGTDAMVRAGSPAVLACDAVGAALDGPCQLAVKFYDALELAGNPTGATPLTPQTFTLDDCGRYVAHNIPRPALGFLGIGVDDAAAAADLHRLTVDAFPVTSGAVVRRHATYAFTTATDDAWSTAVGFGANTFADRGVLLVQYTHGVAPVAGVTITSNGTVRAADDYYFTDASTSLRQDVVAAGPTGANGTALIINSSLVEHSGQGGEPGTCVWPSSLGAAIPGTLFFHTARAETGLGDPCP